MSRPDSHLPRYDRLDRAILSATGGPTRHLLPFGLEHVAEQAAEAWRVDWQGVSFKITTERRQGGEIVAWLRFETDNDEKRFEALTNGDQSEPA